jgi:protocatechuate 3,4-dioxygenase beta subunit
LLGLLVWWLWADRAGPEVEVQGETTRGRGAMVEGSRDRNALTVDPLRGRLAAIAGTIRDPQGQALANARVCAFAGGQRLTRTERAARCVLSERDGHYRIEALFPVRHQVSAAAPHFVPSHHARGEGAARRDSIDLHAGQELLGVDITLEGGGVEIGGVIRDLSGGAVEGAQVLAGGGGPAAEQVVLSLGETSAPVVITMHPAFHVEGQITIDGGGTCEDSSLSLANAVNEPQAFAQIEGDGRVRARGVQPGTYTISVHCQGFLSAESYPPVVVESAHVTGLRWPVTRGRAIRGGVVDADGRALAQIQVRAVKQADPADPRARSIYASGQTDAQGRFELVALLPGDYALNVSDRREPRALPKEPLVVRVGGREDLEGVRIQLPATGAIRGTLRDQNGRPVTRAQVSLSTGSFNPGAAVADDGSFEFPHVAPGEYRLRATRNHVPLRVPGSSDDDLQGVAVAVRTGQTETVKLVVEAASGKISGVVRDEDGGPVADAFVEAARESESAGASGTVGSMGRWAGMFDRPWISDTDGRFVIESLTPGKYNVRARRRGGGETEQAHVAVGEDVVLTIARTGRIAGTVALAGGQAPAEFTIALRNPLTGFQRNDSFRRTAGAWGFSDVPQGDYALEVHSAEGDRKLTVTLAAGEERSDLRVELLGKVQVTGTVLDLEGAPVAGVEVVISGKRSFHFGGPKGNHITDGAGRFEIEGAPAGPVELMAMGPTGGDYAEIHTSLRLTPPAIELPPLRIAKQRADSGAGPGELGYVLREPEPGADRLQARHLVALVRPGGPAAMAGLQVGDEIVAVDGQDVTGGAAYLHTTLTRVAPGTVVHLGLARGTTVAVTADKAP